MTPSRKIQAAEVAIFLLLIVPSMVLSLFVIRQGQLSFLLAATAIIFRDVGLVCLILFFLWRNGEPVSCVGWTWRLRRRLPVAGKPGRSDRNALPSGFRHHRSIARSGAKVTCDGTGPRNRGLGSNGTVSLSGRLDRPARPKSYCTV